MLCYQSTLEDITRNSPMKVIYCRNIFEGVIHSFTQHLYEEPKGEISSIVIIRNNNISPEHLLSFLLLGPLKSVSDQVAPVLTAM